MGRASIRDVRAPSVVRALPTALLVLALGACGGSGPTGTSAVPSSAPASAATPPGGSGALPATTDPGGGTGTLGGLDVGALLGTTAQPPSTTWIRAVDAGAAFSFEVPSAWSGHLAYPWVEGGATIGTVLVAGPDPTRLGSDFSVPGVAIGLSANPSGMSARASVEADQTYAGTCTPGEVGEASDAGATVAYRLWEACGGGQSYVFLLAVVPADGNGLIAILFQGVDEPQLGYLDHIVTTLRAETVQSTPAPAPSGGDVSGPTYTISMEYCQNQHGQGVSGGLIRNDDSLIHTYRIVVAFSDPNGVFLNDTGWTTSDLQPGVTARWQATVPSGLPAVSVSCQITRVELIR